MGVGVGSSRVGGLGVIVEVAVEDGVSVGVLVADGRCVGVRVADGSESVRSINGITVPGCGGTTSPAFGTSICTQTWATEKGP